jgi:transcription-repair coupling factor (superfamily II helicase)
VESDQAAVKAAIREIARTAAALCGTRVKPGFAFSPDTSWHQGFVEAFEFETEDQLRAIETSKATWKTASNGSPGLRDVGYGKRR